MVLIFKKALNFLYPPTCYNCSLSTDSLGLCTDCFFELIFARNDYCCRCGVTMELKSDQDCFCKKCKVQDRKSFDSFHYCLQYNDITKNIMGKLKYYDQPEIAKYFVNILINRFKEVIEAKKIDIIIPVPIHFTKLVKRKYNHCVLLAKGLGRAVGIGVNISSLKKIRRTKDQMSLSGQERLNNLKDVFKVSEKGKKSLSNKNILLVEDVMTTGSTVNHVALCLKEAGVGRVDVLSTLKVFGSLKV